ncbi:universal stress protein [Chitinophaga sp. 212800010-3]|uniref:universal stress protein n=1 Tax=unclassified Chitinophaga TaxID=2619133 RepID=UPI002DE95424|nr:Universal stress protein [Chitinophaga sp. 212800010-3]
MEKILLMAGGSNPTIHAINFACYLSGITRSKLTGYFFEKELHADKPEMKTMLGFPYVESITNKDYPEYTEKQSDLKSHIRTFEETCEKKGIHATSKYLEEPTLQQLIKESKFADLIIADATVSHIPVAQDAPSTLLQELLASAQCPVVIAPSAFTPVNEVIFCYDGSASSIFAMKQFSYILPEFDNARATVLQIGKEEISIDDKKRISKWLSRHFEYTDIITLKGDAEQQLFDYLLKKKHAMVVMGAYGRSTLSRLFRHSYADLLIKTLAYPVFITHY